MQLSTVPLFLSLLLGPASADDAPPPTLTVTGDAEVSVAPDRARVVLGATVQVADASDAQRQVGEIMTRALEALRGAGVRDEDLTTAGVTLHPVHAPAGRRPSGETEEPRIVAYRASNTVEVVLTDLTRVGATIDAGVGAGANRVQGITFELADETGPKADALAAAVRNARKKAERMADAAGVRLLTLQSATESAGRFVGPVVANARMGAFDAGTPVEPGRITVSGAVSLTYRISGANTSGGGTERGR
ncbi:MAG: SIMPL domain-containing protein [Planctomycetota bacterium JB042]